MEARVVDHDGTEVASPRIAGKLDGLACATDSALNYSALVFSESCALRGGFPRLVLGDDGRLQFSIDVDSTRKLTRAELNALREDFEGQLTDGIGAGCFDDLSSATGLDVQVAFPIRSRCSQEEGTAWKPRATTRAGNQRRIAAVRKLVDATDAKPKPASAEPARPTTPKSRPAKPGSTNAPNLDKLLRLLAKPERDRLFDDVARELVACGNDLSGVEDGRLPLGNWLPKMLRLLLGAGLRPDVLDAKGNPLIVQSAGDPRSLELLLKAGVDVNQSGSGLEATALMRAARLGKRASVELLLRHGADPSIGNRAGKTALDLVDRRSRDRRAIEQLLRGTTSG